MTNKSLKKYCDTLWSKLIKERAGYKCEICQRGGRLNSHHIYSRRYMNLRYDIENGVCLCVKHHMIAHHRPIDFIEEMKAIRGKEWYERLRNKSQLIQKTDLELIKLYLKAELKRS